MLRDGKCFFLRHRDVRVHHGLADGKHSVLELLPVLRAGDGGGVGAQQADAVFVQDARLGKLHRQGQPGLSAETR